MIKDKRRVQELREFSGGLEFSCCDLVVILIKHISGF